jgi:NAD(P)-dependent dehydrogenase (short-subunit alcohol dehydrogenase family)
VAGGGGALGGAVARALGREGASVAIGYRSSEESARSTLADIEASGGTAHVAKVDITDSASVSEFVNETVRRYGRLDVVVNAAGWTDPAIIARFSGADERALTTLLDVDLLGAFRVCQAAAEHLRASGNGAIVNFSSSYGNGAYQDNFISSVAVIYSTVKGSIRAFTSNLARDLAPEIRVNAVAPGPVAANWEEELQTPKELIEQVVATTPLKRFGRPEEIAETVLYLASDGAGYVTGQVLEVSGGMIIDG